MFFSSAFRVLRSSFPDILSPSPRSNSPVPESLTAVFESDLLDPYEKLISIELLGREVEVPEKNRLLRCFQYLSLHTISYGDFCWNGECTNCQFWYHDEGESEAQDKTALSCRFDVREGLVVTRLSPHVEIEGVNK